MLPIPSKGREEERAEQRRTHLDPPTPPMLHADASHHVAALSAVLYSCYKFSL